MIHADVFPEGDENIELYVQRIDINENNNVEQ